MNVVPATAKVIGALEEFSGVYSYTSDQHVELRKSRQTHETKNAKSVLEWLIQHNNPFDHLSKELASLSAGVAS